MSEQAQTIVFVDVEVGFTSHKLQDIGAIRHDGSVFHSTNTLAFTQFVSQCRYVCGHNILQHDAKYIPLPPHIAIIDTLYLSPLLFPRKPYHKLLKDDKLLTEELNNPINDCRKAQSLFFDELEAFRELPPPQQQILGHCSCLAKLLPPFSNTSTLMMLLRLGIARASSALHSTFATFAPPHHP